MDVVASELAQEVEMQRVGVGGWVVVGDPPEQGELLEVFEVVDVDRIGMAGAGPGSVAPAVDEDRGRRPGCCNELLPLRGRSRW
jgi:hypothetical protein